ncbi:MAG: addiction module protein [Planctomycetota bacterium]
MSADEIAAVFDSALSLPESKRADLASQLLDSFVQQTKIDGMSPEFAEEVQRRSAEIDAGEVEMIPWSVVREGIRTRLADRDAS